MKISEVKISQNVLFFEMTKEGSNKASQQQQPARTLHKYIRIDGVWLDLLLSVVLGVRGALERVEFSVVTQFRRNKTKSTITHRKVLQSNRKSPRIPLDYKSRDRFVETCS